MTFRRDSPVVAARTSGESGTRFTPATLPSILMRRRTVVLIAVPVVTVLALAAAVLIIRDERGTIEGTVTFAPGRPAAGLQVHLMLFPLGEGSGTTLFFPVLYPRTWTATTDAQGHHRLTGVRPGSDLVIGVTTPGIAGGGAIGFAGLRPGEIRHLDLTAPRRTR